MPLKIAVIGKRIVKREQTVKITAVKGVVRLL